MKVLFLTHSFPRQPGDAAGLVRAPARDGAARRRHRRRASSRRPRPGCADHDRLDGIPVERFRYAPRRYETLAYTGNMARAGPGLVERPGHDARLPRRRIPVGGARAPRDRAGRRPRALVVPEWAGRHLARPHGQQAARDDAARHRRSPRALGRVLAPRVPPRDAPFGRRDRGVALARRRSAAKSCPRRRRSSRRCRWRPSCSRRAASAQHESAAVRRPAQQAEGHRAAAARAQPHSRHVGRARRRRRRRRSRRARGARPRARPRRSRALARRASAAAARRLLSVARRRSSFRRSTRASGSSPSKRSSARRRSSRSIPADCRTSCSTTAPGILVPRRRRRRAGGGADLAARA